MARKMTFVPNVGGVALIPLEDIPVDVVADVEEAYASLRGHDGRIRVEFDTKEEKSIFGQQATSYCKQRLEGKLTFRWSPSRNLAENVGDFTVKADLPANAESK